MTSERAAALAVVRRQTQYSGVALRAWFSSPQKRTHRRHHLWTGMFQFCQKYVTVSEFLEEEPDMKA